MFSINQVEVEEVPLVKGSVLVVDDMLMHLQTAKLYLEMAGYKVVCASDTNSAWRLVNKEKPDLIILDVIIPGGNGLELMSRIKEHFPNIGVIIMTAYGNEDIAATAIKLGALDYLRKPVRYNTISKVVEKALYKQRQETKQQVTVNNIKNAYEQLQVSAESILRCISAAVVAVDKNLCIRIINQKAKDLLETNTQDVKGSYFYDVFPCFKSSKLLKYTLEHNRGVQLYEVEIHSVSGTKILNINTDIIYDHQNEPIGAVAVINDVTELRQKENLLKEKEKLAIVGQMAACMAHEIKNPLTAIKGFGQILTTKIKDEGLVDYLHIMNSEINRMSQVIQDFLVLAKPQPPQLIKANINELISDMMLIIEPQALLKNISISIQLAESIPLVSIDSSKIKQVLLNLTQNAFEAMESSGTLSIATSFLAEQGEVKVDVKDTGCGISKNAIKDLGVPFTTTKPTGTGLGLSITFTIIEQHQGRVEVQSEEGVGTTFSIYLPVRAR